MRGSAAALGAGLALAAAGCGGATSAPPPRTVPLTAQEQRGRTLYVGACGSCHALADAGTAGSAGPRLDDRPRSAAVVLEAIADGPGLMPAELLKGRDAAAVAAYVAAVSGG